MLTSDAKSLAVWRSAHAQNIGFMELTYYTGETTTEVIRFKLSKAQCLDLAGGLTTLANVLSATYPNDPEPNEPADNAPQSN